MSEGGEKSGRGECRPFGGDLGLPLHLAIDRAIKIPTLKVWFLAVWFFSLTILLVCLRAWLL